MIKTEKSQNTNVRNQRGAIVPEPMGVKRVIKELYEKLYAHKRDN